MPQDDGRYDHKNRNTSTPYTVRQNIQEPLEKRERVMQDLAPVYLFCGRLLCDALK